MIDHSRPFSVEFMTEAAKGTPAVAMAAFTMNDLLIALSIVYVLAQLGYLAWKWFHEAKAKKGG